MKFSERLAAAMEHRKSEGAASLARDLTRLLRDLGVLQNADKPIPPQTIQSILADRSKTSAYTVHLAYLLRVNPYWLALGIGDMLDDTAQITNDLTAGQLELARLWGTLPQQEQQLFWSFLRTLTDRGNEAKKERELETVMGTG